LRTRHPALLAAGWALCLLALYFMVASIDYPLRDPDSTLYESISAQLSRRPVGEWIAPLFPPGRFKEGLFLEHLAAFFWPAAALGKLGFSRGALLANFLYFAGCLYLLFRLAASVADEAVGWGAVCSFAISPLGIQYLLRANHENAWALAFLGGFWCLRELPRSRWFGAGFALCGLLAFAVKGVLALSFFPVMLAFWRVASKRWTDLAWFAASGLLIAVFAASYELAFRRATGRPFFSPYLEIQTGYVAAFEQRAVWKKLSNPVYYLANILWFALPGSLCAAVGFWRARRRREPLRLDQWTALAGSGTLVLLLSTMTRRAARYIFPAYALVHIPGARTLLELFPAVRRFLEGRRAWMPYLLMAGLLVLLPLRVAFDLRFYRFVRIFE
jgi:glycosyl transferase family 87